MTPVQCRMARAALGWTTVELAQYAGVNQVTLNRYEKGDKKWRQSTTDKLRKAFEDTGEITFVDDNTVVFLSGAGFLRNTD